VSFVVVPRETLQVVFDVAVESLDFASGFLDNDEVMELRCVAGLLGVDPMKATPHNFDLKIATCEHDWEYADQSYRVKAGVEIVWHGRTVTDPKESLEITHPGDRTMLVNQVKLGNLRGPDVHWTRRCRKCGCHETEDLAP